MVEPWLVRTRQGNEPGASELLTWDLPQAAMVGEPPGHGLHPLPPVLLTGTTGLLGLRVSRRLPPVFGLTTSEPLAHSHGLQLWAGVYTRLARHPPPCLLSETLTSGLKAGPHQATSTPSLWEIQALPATVI